MTFNLFSQVVWNWYPPVVPRKQIEKSIQFNTIIIVFIEGFHDINHFYNVLDDKSKSTIAQHKY